MNKYQEALNTLREKGYINHFQPITLEYQYFKEFKTLQELVDKETPKKKIQTSKLTYICPCCLENDIKNFVYGNYCDECGQRLE